MGDGNHRCGPNPLCPDRMETKCRAEIGSRSPVQSSTDTPGTSASTPTSSSEDGHDKLLGVDPDYCRRILVRGKWTKTKRAVVLNSVCKNSGLLTPSMGVSIKKKAKTVLAVISSTIINNNSSHYMVTIQTLLSPHLQWRLSVK